MAKRGGRLTTDDGGNRLCGWMERRSTKGVDDGQSKNIGACKGF